MNNLVYTLLLTQDQKCSKCFSLATHILLGKENEFIGFFCQSHGEEFHNKLENKYQFEDSLYKPKSKTRKVRRKRF